MNKDEAKASSKSDQQRFCHVCAHPLHEGAEKCPECDTPVANVPKILESALGDEHPQVKKAKERKAIINIIDDWSLHLVGTLLIASVGLMYKLVSLANENWWEIPGISNWLLGYSVAILMAFVILFRISRKLARYHDDKLKD